MNFFDAYERVSNSSSLVLDPLFLGVFTIGVGIFLLLPITWIWFARKRSYSTVLTLAPAVPLIILGYIVATSSLAMLGIYTLLLLAGILVSKHTRPFLLNHIIAAIGVSAVWNYIIDLTLLCKSLLCGDILSTPVVYQTFPELLDRCDNSCESPIVIGLTASEFFGELFTILLPGLVCFSFVLLYYWLKRQL